VLSVPHPLALSKAMAGEGGSDQGERSSYMQLFRTEGFEDQMLADGQQGLRNLYLASGMHGDDADAYLDALGNREALRAALNWYRAADPSIAEGLGPITMPTLFIWSTDDAALGPDAAYATADYVEGPYRFEVLEGVNHWVPEQAPDEVGRLVLDHLVSEP
jgi:pimeloyl-ACP methyl ester carboxylesterase